MATEGQPLLARPPFEWAATICFSLLAAAVLVELFAEVAATLGIGRAFIAMLQRTFVVRVMFPAIRVDVLAVDVDPVPLVDVDVDVVVVAGRLHVAHDDAAEAEVGAGEAYNIQPGHDAWVVGDEPFIAYEFDTTAADTYARPS